MVKWTEPDQSKTRINSLRNINYSRALQGDIWTVEDRPTPGVSGDPLYLIPDKVVRSEAKIWTIEPAVGAAKKLFQEDQL